VEWETVYNYDDNSSLKTRTTGDKNVTYHWENDGENRLKGVDIVEGGQTTEIDYEYNEQGIRTGKSVNGVETNYLIDELQPYAQVLEEYDALGNLQNAYVYGNDLVSQSDNNETFFYHVDGLGSTRVLTDESGNIEESYNYYAYGNLMVGDASENAYLFAGEQRDIETGLDYLRARYYDPTLGRFIAQDAYAGSLDDPMSLHKYQYAHANPVVNTDPSGYFSLTETLVTSAIIGITAGLSYTTGSAIRTLANGGSVDDAIGLYDQYFAGFSDIATFGISTKLRNKFFSDVASRNHRGAIFNMGRLGGAVASIALGWFSGSKAAASSPLWATRFSVAYTTTGNTVASFNSFYNILKNGKITFTDLLGFLPSAAAGFSWAIGLKPTLAGSLGSSGAWRNLPGGVRIKQVGNYFIKEANPNANLLEQIYAVSSLDEQAKGLALLGDMAPSFLYKNGKLITRNAGDFVSGNIWTTRLKASLRLGTPFNDVVGRNIGANGLIFDPSKIPVQQAAEAILTGISLAYVMNGASTIFRGDR
jgi:RHS repeat-associated protein